MHGTRKSFALIVLVPLMRSGGAKLMLVSCDVCSNPYPFCAARPTRRVAPGRSRGRARDLLGWS